jgi:hypothetical protein
MNKNRIRFYGYYHFIPSGSIPQNSYIILNNTEHPATNLVLTYLKQQGRVAEL